MCNITLKRSDNVIKLGVSSACFYPLETEKAFDKVCEIGCGFAEVFLCAPSELDETFIRQIKEHADAAGINILSVHPFSSFMENTFLFSPYYRRYTDSIALYKRFFEICAYFGSDILVMHGAKDVCAISDEEYCERFAALSEIGKEYGVCLCQENVVHYRAESTEYLKKMAHLIGDGFGITLDIKQARRAGTDEFELIKKLAPFIKHVHISDCNSQKDCLPPGKGTYDFGKLFKALSDIGYTNGAIIELYRSSYSDESEVGISYNALNSLLKSHF